RSTGSAFAAPISAIVAANPRSSVFFMNIFLSDRPGLRFVKQFEFRRTASLPVKSHGMGRCRRSSADALDSSLEADDHAVRSERELQPLALRPQFHGDALVIL